MGTVCKWIQCHLWCSDTWVQDTVYKTEFRRTSIGEGKVSRSGRWNKKDTNKPMGETRSHNNKRSTSDLLYQSRGNVFGIEVIRRVLHNKYLRVVNSDDRRYLLSIILNEKRWSFNFPTSKKVSLEILWVRVSDLTTYYSYKGNLNTNLINIYNRLNLMNGQYSLSIPNIWVKHLPSLTPNYYNSIIERLSILLVNVSVFNLVNQKGIKT